MKIACRRLRPLPSAPQTIMGQVPLILTQPRTPTVPVLQAGHQAAWLRLMRTSTLWPNIHAVKQT